MAKTCIKCGYARRDTDAAPSYECPSCGVVYEKAEAAHAQQVIAHARTAALAVPLAAERPPVKPPEAPPTAAANARAEALAQQLLLAQAGERRGKNPHRGMAIAVLVAFSVGFASAAMLYSGAAKLAKQPQRCECRGA